MNGRDIEKDRSRPGFEIAPRAGGQAFQVEMGRVAAARRGLHGVERRHPVGARGRAPPGLGGENARWNRSATGFEAAVRSSVLGGWRICRRPADGL